MGTKKAAVNGAKTQVPSNGNIYARMSAIMREVESISKTRRNESQGYSFRGIDDIYNAVHPIFRKHGVFITTEVLESKREERQTARGSTLIYSVIKLRVNYNAEDGSSIFSTVEGEGMDSGDKATNKALSAALKYSIMQTLLIPTEDKKDSEYDNHEVLPKKNILAVEVNDTQNKIEDEKKAAALEKLNSLPGNIKEGFKILGYSNKAAWVFCEKFKWDEAAILKNINQIVDSKK